LLGVGLNAVVPAMAFEIALNATALAILCTWGTIVLCQLKLYKLSKKGLMLRPAFRMLGAPWTSYLTLAFLAAVLVLMVFDFPVGTYTVASLAIIIPALIAGWFAVRKRVNELAIINPGSHALPVIASTRKNETEDSAS
jgi:L-asparagine permease